MEAAKTSDRRQFFRVDDEVYMDYRLVSDHERLRIAHEIRAGIKSAGQLLHDLESNEELRALRMAVAQTDSTIADYLQVIEEKLVILTRIVAGAGIFGGEMKFCSVSLSGGGIAFAVTEPFALGTELEISLTLPPRNHGIRALARVGEVGQEESGGYRVATEFTVIDGADRDLIIARVLARQAESLRAARAGRDPNR